MDTTLDIETFYLTNLYCTIKNENNIVEIIFDDYGSFYVSTMDTNKKNIIVSTANLKYVNDMEKLSDELKIDKKLLTQVINERKELYKEFYQQSK